MMPEKHLSPHDLQAAQAADELVALLTLCQQLQSEKDGRERPAPGTYSREEDDFADRIRSACGYALQLRQSLPVMSGLSVIGTELERRGEIHVMTGESYADRALTYLMTQYLPAQGETP